MQMTSLLFYTAVNYSTAFLTHSFIQHEMGLDQEPKWTVVSFGTSQLSHGSGTNFALATSHSHKTYFLSHSSFIWNDVFFKSYLSYFELPFQENDDAEFLLDMAFHFPASRRITVGTRRAGCFPPHNIFMIISSLFCGVWWRAASISRIFSWLS